MAKIKRPTVFKLGTFDWTIKYLDFESDLHGDTCKDTKAIRVFVHGYTEQVIKDTVLHECLHVCLEDIIETTSKIEDKPDVVEEQVIRLLTPRLHELFTNNEELREYLFTKSVDKPVKK